MRKIIQQKLKEQKGLTLIELLAVIVILAIIAAIAIPAIGNIIENSRVGAIKSDALNVLAASELYYTENTDGTEQDPVLLATLLDGYLDDAGSFKDSTAPVEVTSDGKITGDGKVGGVTLLFSTATKAEINAVKNSDTGANTSSTVVVSGR